MKLNIYLKEVAKILGVKFKQPFNIKNLADNPYKICEEGLICLNKKLNDDDLDYYLAELIKDNLKIDYESLDYSTGDTYYYFNEYGLIVNKKFKSSADDLARIKCGWIFRTLQHAEDNKERVCKEMGITI